MRSMSGGAPLSSGALPTLTLNGRPLKCLAISAQHGVSHRLLQGGRQGASGSTGEPVGAAAAPALASVRQLGAFDCMQAALLKQYLGDGAAQLAQQVFSQAGRQRGRRSITAASLGLAQRGCGPGAGLGCVLRRRPRCLAAGRRD